MRKFQFYDNSDNRIRSRVSLSIISVSEKDDTIGISLITQNFDGLGKGDVTKASDKGINDKDQNCSSENNFSHSTLGGIMKFLRILREKIIQIIP